MGRCSQPIFHRACYYGNLGKAGQGSEEHPQWVSSFGGSNRFSTMCTDYDMTFLFIQYTAL
jgi:hypothetical protein